MISDRKIVSLAMVFSTLLMGCSKPDDSMEKGALPGVETSFLVDDTLCEFALGRCTQDVQGATVSLGISPENTPSEQPLKVSLEFTKPIEDLKIRVEGRDMFMGIIPLKLAQSSESLYQGDLIYGSCSSNYMVWRMFVSFSIDEKSHTVLFDFLADNDDPSR